MSFWPWLELKHGVPVLQVFLVYFYPISSNSCISFFFCVLGDLHDQEHILCFRASYQAGVGVSLYV